MTLEKMKNKFLDIQNKGINEGLVYDDYLILKKMRDQLGLATDPFLKKHDYLNNDLFSVIETLYKKGMTGLLSYNDYILLKENVLNFDSEISSYFSSEEEYIPSQELFGDINEVLADIFNKGLLHKFSKSDCDYISKNSFVLPLILANNTYSKIRLTGDNRYMFLCQMHYENTPSLGVNDLKNYFLCYGCGYSGNAISYLMKYENLSFPDAIQLLAQIYLFDVKKDEEKFLPLVQKYQKTILGNEYQELLESGFDRLKVRNISEINGQDIEVLYKNRYDTITRIKNGIVDDKFIYEGPKKLIYLKEK